MSRAEQVIVIGAGIVGTATALRLVRRGLAVQLLDRAEPGEGASFRNAGVLAAGSVVPVSVPGLLAKPPGMLLQRHGPLYLRWSYLPRLLPWLIGYLRAGREDRVRHIAPMVADSLDEHRALARGTSAAECIRAIPYAFVFTDRDTFARDPFGWQLRREQGIGWDVFEGDAVREAEPTLSPRYRCLVEFTEQHGVIDDPGTYVKRLALALAAEGGEVRRTEVRRLLAESGRVSAVEVDGGERIPCSRVVVATGAWSGRLLGASGIRVPMESERGYHVELHGVSTRPQRALMVADGKFVATPMSARIRLAGLVEFGGLDAPAGAAPIRTLLERARTVFPDLRYEHHSEWLGHRPALPDSLPVIGESRALPGLFMAFGHHHVGLTSGPRTSRWVADLVAGTTPNVDLGAYRLERFD